MTRLQRELARLYLVPATVGPVGQPGAAGLVDGLGRVRAMVLALAGPADWALLGPVWRGVQADLALPAPAIAVSGDGALQLWFSVDPPVPGPEAHAFLDALRQRYLGDVAAQRLALLPALPAAPAEPLLHARPVPAEQAGSGRWSAFVAADLAPVFGDEPWLDLPPNRDGQAHLLAALDSMAAGDLQQAWPQQAPADLPARAALAPAATAAQPAGPAGALDDAGRDAQRFLLGVMNDERVALGLRIDAAKALLPGLIAPQRP